MESIVLIITVLISCIFLNAITISESIPLRKQPRMTLADWTNYNSFQPEGSGTYSFGYDIEDPDMDNIQFRDEERHPNGTVIGSYGYLRPDGIVHIVHYTADQAGFRARFENYPRGQLKPFSSSNLLPEGSTLSPALTAALQSKTVYKKQHVHEQRLRPTDTNHKHNLPVPSYVYADNTKAVYNRNPASFSNFNDVRTQYIHPYRLFVNRN